MKNFFKKRKQKRKRFYINEKRPAGNTHPLVATSVGRNVLTVIIMKAKGDECPELCLCVVRMTGNAILS